MVNIAKALQSSINQLTQSDIRTSYLDSVLIMCHILGVSHDYLIRNNNNEIPDKVYQSYLGLLKRRLSGEPVAKIIGKKEFYGREFIVNQHVLDPRSESELLIDTIKEVYPISSQKFSILDLGTGSGCLLLSALLEYKAAHGIGIDISTNAIGVAVQNSLRYSLSDRAKFLVGNWIEPIASNSFDIILANPPYIPESDIPKLAIEVRSYDPIIALDGGDDGLKEYKVILKQLQKIKSKNGSKLIMEIYNDNAEDLIDYVNNIGLAARDENIRYDMNRKKRVLIIDL
tara:strand:+ start:957 stop:1814 length:858 start_codon:yes stop_codon:yes gene_type:complete